MRRQLGNGIMSRDMSYSLLDLYLRYRTALPLASFLLYLNTTIMVSGRISTGSVLCALSFFALYELIYAYDARFRNREDVVNIPGGRVVRHSSWRLLAAAAVPVYILAAAGFLQLLMYAAVVMIVYSDPRLFPKRFKAIPGLKVLANMLNFWTVGILAPVIYQYGFSVSIFIPVLKSSIHFLILLFCLNVLADIRDVTGDREAGVWTFPAVLGVPASVLLVIVLLTAAAMVSLVQGEYGGGFLSASLAVFSFLTLKPRARLYYEWVFGFTNVYLVAVLIYRLH